jgi:hypothetical protein
LAGGRAGPFGHEIRLRLMEFGVAGGTERLGTYGFITGGRYFVGSPAPRGPAGAYDYGYCLELAVLRLVAMGLGTCWLAGFQRGPVIEQLLPGPGEIVPAVVAVGWPEERRSVREQLIRRMARGDGRKPWAQLFADAASAAPLTAEDAGAWREALEAVRLAPSAANRQRWRVLRETRGDLSRDGRPGAGHALTWHFCSEGHAGVDMGIAMLHFEVAAQESGLPGRWVKLGGGCPRRPGLLYVSSWVAGH